jgi:hypothetical protein
MTAHAWTNADSRKARQIWEDYQKQHDVSASVGQAVGIDPVTGGVWFGESARAIADLLDGQGIGRPLYFLRVGFSHYQRKGHRQVRSGLLAATPNTPPSDPRRPA